MTDEQYYELIQPYTDAKEIMLSRLNTLKHNLYSEPSCKPIHNIQDRIKKKNSIEKKLAKKGVDATSMNAKDYLQDIAGLRVICYFVNDIYRLVDTIKIQADLIIIRENDYISNPKPNGYRSYHLIVGIPMYYADGMEYFPVEIQFRTMAMDFWASMEHRILYKQIREDKAEVDEERKLSPTTILSFLSRLQEKGFLTVEKVGKNNLYSPLIAKESYMQKESKNILKRLYQNSAKNFLAALYDGDNLSQEDLKELEEYIREKSKKS